MAAEVLYTLRAKYSSGTDNIFFRKKLYYRSDDLSIAYFRFDFFITNIH